MARRMDLAISTFTSAAWASSIQAVAIFVLDPTDYGRFALAYIFYAIASFLVLAVVSDAWARAGSRNGIRATWVEYSTALVLLVAGIGTIFFPLFLLLGLNDGIFPLVTAIVMSAYRLGARYYWVVHGSIRVTVLPDAAAILVMIITFLPIAISGTVFSAVCWSWAAGSTASALFSKWPRLKLKLAVRRWLRRHGSDVKILAFDSLAVEGASLGIPLLLAGLMGPTRFGIYRAISSTAIPVRLVINPLRPILMSKPRSFYSKTQTRLLSVTIGGVTGFGVYVALTAISHFALAAGSTVSELANYAFPASIYVASNFVSSLYYIANRTHLSGRHVLILRLVQTTVSVFCPLFGYSMGELDGAITGFVLSAVINTVISVGATGRKGDPRHG